MISDEEREERREQRQAKRWSTGWVVLPGTRHNPGVHAHRPHPDRPFLSVCDRVIRHRPVIPMTGAPVPAPKCVRCEVKSAREKAAESRSLRVRERELQRAKDLADRARREKYGAYQPGSVRTVGGGLPGLGKRS